MPLPPGAPTPSFTAMSDATREEWLAIHEQFDPFARELPQRVMGQLEALRGGVHGFAVDRLEHCLQTATRAHRDGRDEEYVVCALVHDIGDLLCPYNHTEVATAMLRPFVSADNLWMVEKHGLFQTYYYNHHLDLDPHARDVHIDHPCYDRTVEFCALYDQVSFDPDYDSLPLDYFGMMVANVLGQPRLS